MRKNTTFILLAASLLVAGPPTVFAQSPTKKPAANQSAAERTEEARKAIQAALNDSDAALIKKDVKRVFAAATPDFVAISQNGQKRTLKEFRDNYAAMLPAMTSIEAATSIEDITVKGDTASVTVTGHTRLQGLLPNGQALDIVADNQERQFWVKAKGVWRIKRSRTLVENATANGKVMNQ